MSQKIQPSTREIMSFDSENNPKLSYKSLSRKHSQFRERVTQEKRFICILASETKPQPLSY